MARSHTSGRTTLQETGHDQPTTTLEGAAAKAILVVMDLLDAKELVCEISTIFYGEPGALIDASAKRHT
jgi:hypothetical protein